MSGGGPMLGSGRKAGNPELTRTEPVRVMLRASERDDLMTLAEAWGVPLSTATWALVATELARIRGGQVELGTVELAMRATARVLVQARPPAAVRAGEALEMNLEAGATEQPGGPEPEEPH
jgi:hypothetical protein